MIWNYRDLPSILERSNFQINEGEMKSYSKSLKRMKSPKTYILLPKLMKIILDLSFRALEISLPSNISYEP